MKTSTTAERLQQIMDERNLKQVDVLALAQPYWQDCSKPIYNGKVSAWAGSPTNSWSCTECLRGLAHGFRCSQRKAKCAHR